MTRSAELIQSNTQVYRIYSRRLANPADPHIFITAARKLTVFLSDQRAYYAEAQQPIVEILEIACNSLKNVAPNVFSTPGSLDRSSIPPDKAPLFDAFNKLANSVAPYVFLFADTTLNNRLVSFLSSVGIAPPGGTTNVPHPDRPRQISATCQVDPTESPAQPSSPIGTASPEIVILSLPSTSKGAAGVQPTALPTSAPQQLPSSEAKGNNGGAFVQPTPNRPATQSPVDELRAPIPGEVNSAHVERNRNIPAPPPLLPTSVVSSSLRTESASPISALRVVPQSSQKFPDNTSVPSSPASANLTSQRLVEVSQSQSVPAPQAKTPIQPLISTSSGQNEPRPPRKRQSSGLDFLQLDLQVARQKKLMAAKQASGAQKSGTTRAPAGAVPSPTTKDGPAVATVSPTSITSADIPNIPAALTSTPTVPAALQATLAQSPSTTQAPILAITTSLSNTTSQPQVAQSLSPTLVHRDLRQGSSRVRTFSASSRKLRISDRAPAPEPEPGSSSAPIIIDEGDVSMSTPLDEPIDADVPLQPPIQTEETTMVLDSDLQNVQGSNRDVKDDHKPQHDQERKELPEQHDSPHEKQSGAQLEQTKDRRKTVEDSMEGPGTSNKHIVPGATIVPSLGNEAFILGKDSIHTAVGVISAPKGKDTEMTTPAPPPTAVSTEPSAASDQPTIPAQLVVVGPSSPGTVTLGAQSQPQEQKSISEMSVDPSLLMGQARSHASSISSGKASVSTPHGPSRAQPSRIGSLSDMDISVTSETSTPPIVVLGTRAPHSRSTSPQSGMRSSVGITEPVRADETEEGTSEMVDELAPLFGKEMTVICMDRAFDVSGEFKFEFTLSHTDWDSVSRWAKAPENLDLDITPSRCITLACYLMQELGSYATQDGLLREQWFENVKPVSWANLPPNLWAQINDETLAVFPPYSSPDDLFDVSPYLRPGHNKICFTQIGNMAEYVFVLHGHRPTRGQLVLLKARWDQERHFREQLSFLSRPFIIDDW